MLVINHGLAYGPNETDTTKVIVVGESLALKLENKEDDDVDAHFNSKEIEAQEVKTLVLSHLAI